MNIAVFGTVGAGKTTFCNKVSKELGFTVFQEPLEKNPYFEDYYADMKKYCFNMQIYMLTSRLNFLFESKIKNNLIFDRAIIEDPVFVRVQKRLNIFNDRDYKTYNDFYDKVITKNIDQYLKLNKIVYLRVSTEKAIERIFLRGRQSEINTSKEYWEILNEEYEILYNQLKEKYDFFVIDANNDIDKNVNIFLKHLKEK